MVQSLGISVGNSNSYVAASQGGGIEILLNEYSNRSTPSMVAFTDHSRSIGVDASSNFFMNLKNTIYDLMVLVGKSYDELTLEDSAGNPIYPFKIEKGDDGQPLVVVRHLGEERKFTITQVLAMLFTKLRGVADNATDCVISCPQFFTDSQKSAIFTAAQIAGLKPFQIISDMSAVVLNYAYYRTTSQDPHKFIAFINFGQSNLQTVIAWLNPKDDLVRILASESESIGGRDFDKVLADHFVREHKLNLTPKAYLKLVNSCEKLKRLLSANANEIPLHVESLISEDKDFSARIDRATFENLSKSILDKVEDCMRRALDNAKKNFETFIVEIAESAKAAEIARADETAKAVEAGKKAEAAKAHRAALAKAWEEAKAAKAAEAPPAPQPNTEGGEDASDSGIGDTKSASSGDNKEQPMDAEPEELTKATSAENKLVHEAKVAKYNEKAASSKANKLSKLSQIKFDLQVVEMVGGSIRIPAVKQLAHDIYNIVPSTTLNTDEAVARGCVLHCATLHPGMKVKRLVTIDGADTFFKSDSLVCDKRLLEIETELITSDAKYKSRTESRNTLEEYIYSERSKLKEDDAYLGMLNQVLDWVFSEEGEEAPEEEYLNKLGDLKRANQASQPAKPAEAENATQEPAAAATNGSS